MADIKRCDRCGEAYNPYNDGMDCFDRMPDIDEDLNLGNCVTVGIEMDGHLYSERCRKFDLCQNCMRELIQFITREGESKSE